MGNCPISLDVEQFTLQQVLTVVLEKIFMSQVIYLPEFTTKCTNSKIPEFSKGRLMKGS